MQSDSTSPFPPLQVREGVIALDGFGISVTVNRGHLVLADGLGAARRSLTLNRATSGLQRVVLLGWSGLLSLEAVRWLGRIGAAMLYLPSDDSANVIASPSPRAGHPIARVQALAPVTALGLEIARYLIAHKIRGQGLVAQRYFDDEAEAIDLLRDLERDAEAADSLDALRLIEAAASKTYFAAWRHLELRFATRDLGRVPAHWTRYEGRASALTGGPRRAVDPPNALLNYLYALLEAESRLACLRYGIDPMLGVMHADVQARDSMALDLMEPARSAVDSWLLDLLRSRTFTAKDFTETPSGECRLLGPLSHDLAATLPRWRAAVEPHASWLFRTLRSARLDLRASGALFGRITQSVDRLTDAARRGSRTRHRPKPATPTLFGMTCRRCGSPVSSRGRYCAACLEALAAGRIAPGSRSEALARSRALTTAQAIARDPERWARIAPRLKALNATHLARVMGVSRTYASRVRNGLEVPNPRHWNAIERFIEDVPAPER